MISYRKFKRKDLKHLAIIYEEGFSPLYGEKTQTYAKRFIELYETALLQGVEGEMFIAEEGHKPVGFAVIHEESPNEYKFGPMVILPSFQRQGIGIYLLQLCVDYARSKKISKFYLKVHDINEPAINLYKKLGFLVSEILPSDLKGVEYLKMVYKL